MHITFVPFTDEWAARAYDDYRATGLKDAPARAFAELPKEEQSLELERVKTYRKLACVDDQVVGWVGIRPREEEQRIHVGFGLFAAHRGRGLMKPILARRLEEFVRDEYPRLAQRFPLRELYATSEPANTASIRTLEACGFERLGIEITVPGPGGEMFEGLVFRRRF